MDEQPGKSKGYGFVTVLTHISEELMKLNGLEFTGKNVVIEETRKKPSKRRKLPSILSLLSILTANNFPQVLFAIEKSLILIAVL